MVTMRMLAIRMLERLIKAIDETDIEVQQRMVNESLCIAEKSEINYINLLLLLVNEPNHAGDAMNALAYLCSHQSAKEILLSLEDELLHLQDFYESVQLSESESEAEGDIDSEEGHHTGPNDDAQEGVDWNEVVKKLEIILDCYSIAIPRLTNKRSTPTLLSFADKLKPLLPLISNGIKTDTLSRCFRQMIGTFDVIVEWVKSTEDKGGEQNSILSELIFMALTYLTPNLSIQLFESYFLRTRPKFATLRQQPVNEGDIPQSDSITKALTEAAELLIQLNIPQTKLLDILINPSSTSPFPPLGSLHLLASQTASTTLVPYLQNSGADIKNLLSDSMPILSAALSGTAVDSGLTWTWFLIDQGSQVEYDSATMLLELLVPLAASAPNPTAQTGLLKLIEAIVQNAKAEDQVLLLKQLIEDDNPFDQIRVQSLSLLRVITSEAAKSGSTFLSPTIIYTLFPILYSIPNHDPPIFSLPLNHLLSTPYPTWFTECANYLWFILEVDIDNLTELNNQGEMRKKLEAIKTDWLDVQLKRLVELKEDSVVSRLNSVDLNIRSGDQEVPEMNHQDGNGIVDGIQFEAQFLLDMWEDSLQRAMKAVDRVMI